MTRKTDIRKQEITEDYFQNVYDEEYFRDTYDISISRVKQIVEAELRVLNGRKRKELLQGEQWPYAKKDHIQHSQQILSELRELWLYDMRREQRDRLISQRADSKYTFIKRSLTKRYQIRMLRNKKQSVVLETAQTLEEGAEKLAQVRKEFPNSDFVLRRHQTADYDL